MCRLPVAFMDFGTTDGKLLQMRGICAKCTETGEARRAFRKRSIPTIVGYLKNAKGRRTGGQSGPVECFTASLTQRATNAKFVEGLERPDESAGRVLRAREYVDALLMPIA